MIISASRRTDIPAFYSDWLLNRIKEGYVYVQNPINIHQVSKIALSPNVVDCIVFWSKNPKPLLAKLDCLNEYAYYFQFTLNPYDKDIETNLPSKDEIIETFKRLSDKIGAHKVIWRYDPVLLNDKYTIIYHIDKFNEIALKLKGYTEKVTFSFIDFYKKISESVRANSISLLTIEEKISIAEAFSKIAKENNLKIDTCAEDIELLKYDIEHARCIDDKLIAKITGYGIAAKKDKYQRFECGCVESIDIGKYNSCSNGCVYCYANYNSKVVENNIKKHNELSPLLINDTNLAYIVKERKLDSNKSIRYSLF